MSTIAHDADNFVAPAEVPEMELYHPKTWLGKYVFSQDAKVIAVQYACTAMGIGFIALVMSMLMRLQLGFPGTFSFINPSVYIP
jgi:cytochrome c oxidase subunit 1